MNHRLLCTQPTPDSGTPCSWYAKLGQFSNYLAGKLENFHLASLMVGSEAPEELILRRVAVGYSSVV